MPELFDKSREGESIEGLIDLGLTEKEAVVYLALLRLGEVGSSKIIAATGLHGQYVYDCLKSLENKGLAGSVIERGRRKFFAHDPQRLVSVVEAKKDTATTLAEVLGQGFVPTREGGFEVFRGRESFVAGQFELLRQAREGTEVLILGDGGESFQKTMGIQMLSYEGERIAKGISVRYLADTSQKASLEMAKRIRRGFEFRLLPGRFNGEVETQIWPGAVSSALVLDKPVSCITKSVEAAEAWRQIFEMLWGQGAQMAGSSGGGWV